ncbi:MAG: hypothetical protein MZV64_05065 [Ignavibacteriales bacterium]|nr:hypothetical protein [Ignavibacteriales bacterium]
MAIVDELGASMGRQFDAISRTSLLALQHYHWPGNIRELRNVVERAMITTDGPVLNIELPSTPVRRPGSAPLSLKALEREHVLAVLQQTGWRIRGPRGAAVIAGVAPDDTREPDGQARNLEARQETPIVVESPIYGRTLSSLGVDAIPSPSSISHCEIGLCIASTVPRFDPPDSRPEICLLPSVVQLYVRLPTGETQTPDMVRALSRVMVSAQVDRGCGHAELARDVGDSSVLIYVEDWENRERPERRIRSERFGALLGLMEACSPLRGSNSGSSPTSRASTMWPQCAISSDGNFPGFVARKAAPVVAAPGFPPSARHHRCAAPGAATRQPGIEAGHDGPCRQARRSGAYESARAAAASA